MFEQIKNRTPKCININKMSSVLIPLIKVEDEYHILFELRSSSLHRQPNEICFPGGRMDPSDIDTQETAIRETSEELLIDRDSIHILGALDYYVNVNNMRVDAYLGELFDYQYTFNEEVQEVFTVPLSFFMNNEPEIYYNHITFSPDDNFPFNMITNGKDYKWAKGKTDVPFYFYKDKIIWGLTARLLYHNLKYIK